MVNRSLRAVPLEVALGHIGLVSSSMWQDVIPRLVLGRTRPSDLLVPFIRPAKFWVDIDHHASVSEELVMHEFADRKPRS